MGSGIEVVVITGANGGIGLEATRSMLASSYRVAALDVATEALERLGEHHTDLLVLQCDVRSDADVRRSLDAVLRRWDRIDVLVNNAAVARYGRLEDTTLDSARDSFEVNVMGYIRMIDAVAPVMRTQGGGTIVNVASMLSFVGLPSLPVYAASKGAVEGLSRALALDLRQDGIRVKLFHPPSTRTPAAQPLRLPAIFTGDPVKVGAALARSPRSRRAVVTADIRTALTLAVAKAFPRPFGRFLTWLVRTSQRRADLRVRSRRIPRIPG